MRVWATLRAMSKGVWIEGLSPLAMERAALGWGCGWLREYMRAFRGTQVSAGARLALREL